jgi:hypothetical protein
MTSQSKRAAPGISIGLGRFFLVSDSDLVNDSCFNSLAEDDSFDDGFTFKKCKSAMLIQCITFGDQKLTSP